MIKKEPKISIITACYNSASTIEQTIQSVLNQTYNNIEYIIIDGASTDGTMDIVKKYLNQIDMVVSEKDRGVYDAFNKGLNVSTGDYILYLNSDDYFYENIVIEKLANFIKENNFPIGVYGDIYRINDQTGFVEKCSQRIDLNKMKDAIMPPHPAILLSRDVMNDIGGFDLQYKIAADYDLLAKVFLKFEKEILYYPIIVSVFRIGGLSSGFSSFPIVQAETQAIIDKHFLNKKSNFKAKLSYSNEDYLKKWLENILFVNKSISTPLIEKGIKKVVIFGSGEMALLIAHDFLRSGIQVVAFLDNNVGRQGITMNNIPIFSPGWLKLNIESTDAIIYGFQGFHDEVVRKQIESFGLPFLPVLISWRELICEIN